MSWITKLKDIKLEIKTGDGSFFYPLWKDASKNVKYNTEGFDFVNKAGTQVERKQVSGSQYPVTFWFQGEDHLDIANNFEVSAADPRPWTITHPFYGSLLVQPISLEFDNTSYNVTKITGVVWETINDRFPKSKVSKDKTIRDLKSRLDDIIVESFIETLEPLPEDIQPASLAARIFGAFLAVMGELAELKKLVTNAVAAALNLISSVDKYILAAQALINLPFQIIAAIKDKLTALRDSVLGLIGTVTGLFFDSQASFAIGSACVAAIDAASDPLGFENRQEVLDAIEIISETYQIMLDEFEAQEYIQKSETALLLDTIVNLTIDSLYETAFNSKQERIFTLEKDSNIIVLSHRFVGAGDSNLDTFMRWNDFSQDELLLVRKGRKIKYYV